MKWIIAIVFGILLTCVAVVFLLVAGMFVFDESNVGGENSTNQGVSIPRQPGTKNQNPIYPYSDLRQQLADAIPGMQFEKQCQDHTALVRRFYDLGADNIWVQRELRLLKVYIQLPEDTAVRQAIMDRVAAECACGSPATHQHLLDAGGFTVVVLTTADEPMEKGIQ